MKQDQDPFEQNTGAGQASSRIRESVSALMDGEAQELELRRLLAEEHTEEVDQCWQSFHQVRDVLQGSSTEASFRHLDISSQVRLAIAEESVSSPARRPSWLRPVAGFAVAASVAAGLVISVQSTNPVAPGALPAIENTTLAGNRAYPVAGSSMQAASGPTPRGVINYSAQSLPVASVATQSPGNREAQQQLEKYLLRHTESAALTSGQGVMNFARVANFDVEQ